MAFVRLHVFLTYMVLLVEYCRLGLGYRIQVCAHANRSLVHETLIWIRVHFHSHYWHGSSTHIQLEWTILEPGEAAQLAVNYLRESERDFDVPRY